MIEYKNPKDLFGKKFNVLDNGFLVLVDVMGDDSSIVQAARVSYGKGTKKLSEDRGLIRYLMRHRHTTPLEMVEFKFHVKLPIFVARQWIRHRTANVNEYSGRYSILEDEFYIPETDVLAEQSTSNKQGRDKVLPESEAKAIQSKMKEHSDLSYALYEYFLNEGEDEDTQRSNLARELSRIVIPTNIYTQWYWKIDLHNLLHFLSLRLDEHAQYEIREYAKIMGEMVKAFVPIAYEAFEDYRLNSSVFSGLELDAIKTLYGDKKLDMKMIDDACEKAGFKNKREKAEFVDKLNRIFGDIK